MEGGRGLDGLDCWGLVWRAYADLRGIELPRYDRETRHDVVGHLPEFRLVDDPPAAWDILLYRIKGLPCHVALCIAPDRFIHSIEGTGVVIERLSSRQWAMRLEGAYRYDR